MVSSGSLALVRETVVEVEGDAVPAAQAPGGVELHDPSFHVLAEPADPPPTEMRRPVPKETLATALDFAPVALRHPQRRARFEVAAASLHGFRAALDQLGFTEISTPKIVAAATETGANLFSVDYFGRRAFLAQSPQLYKQMLVGVFERVYETGPVFRAEPHDTARHLAEYTSLDAELGFVHDHFDVMAVVREVIVGMVRAVRECAAPAVELLQLARHSPRQSHFHLRGCLCGGESLPPAPLPGTANGGDGQAHGRAPAGIGSQA